MINALSVDVEHWWSNQYLDSYLPQERDDQICESVNIVLNLLDHRNVRATFFVQGTIAQAHPQIVETVSEKGHEIGVHSYSHDPLYNLGANLFESEIKHCLDIISSLTDATISGFRAPFFSMGNNTFGRWKSSSDMALRMIRACFQLLRGFMALTAHPQRFTDHQKRTSPFTIQQAN